MYCSRCGSSIPEDSQFCPVCGQSIDESASQSRPAYGEPIPQTEPAGVGPGTAVAERFASAFRDKLYLALCVLVSAGCGIGVVCGTFNVLGLLMLIFLWQTYGAAQKGAVNVKAMRGVSGTVFTQYVLGWVGVGLLALFGVLMIAVRQFGTEVWDELRQSNEWVSALTETGLVSVADVESVLDAIESVGVRLLFTGLGIGLILAAVLVAVFNRCSIRRFHRLAQSMYRSVETGYENLPAVKPARNWLLVIGIFNGISALNSTGDLFGLLSGGSWAAAYILAYIWVDRHFVKGQY